MKAMSNILDKINATGVQLTREEYEQFQIDSYNESIGELDKQDGLNCDICHNKGFIHYKSQDGYIVAKKCECMKKRETLARAKRSGLGEYLNKTLTDYIATEQWQQLNKLKAANYLKNEKDNNTWFLALGTSGAGKTLLGCIIANNLLQAGKNVMYVTWTDFISRLKRDVMGDNTNEVSKYLDEVKSCEVLFLDELIKKYTDADLRYLIEIINYRYTNDLKTIITSEKVLDELLDIDEATFGRAVEKCNGYLINIPKDRSKNYRLRAIHNNM